MKRFTSRWSAVGLALSLWAGVNVPAAPSSTTTLDGDVVARLHSRGMLDLAADTNGRTFKEIWNLPVSAQLRDETYEKLATAGVRRWFVPKGPDSRTATDAVRLLRPLLSDLGEAETYIEMAEPARGHLDCVVAVRLNEARRRVWETNWAQLTANWDLKTASGPAPLTIVSTNGWFVVQCAAGPTGQGQPGHSAALDRIKQGQPLASKTDEYWVRVETDLAKLSAWLLPQRHDSWPRVDWTVVGRKDALRTEARVTLHDGSVPRIEKWQVPTSFIRDPLISFTALQGIAPWLKRQSFVQELGLENLPSQLFVWGLSQTAFQIQAALPLADPDAVFEKIAEKDLTKLNQTFAEYAVGNVLRLKDRPELVWRGLPILVPYLEPIQANGKGFLHAGIFPVNLPTNQPPLQLFQQLSSQTNLLYYDWEITQLQLNQIRPLLQLSGLFLTLSPMSTNSAAYKWLDMIEPRLGNTVTEVKAVSNHELEFVRTSHLGLNGLELLTLANWIDGTNFPTPNLSIQLRPVVRSNRQKQAVKPSSGQK